MSHSRHTLLLQALKSHLKAIYRVLSTKLRRYHTCFTLLPAILSGILAIGGPKSPNKKHYPAHVGLAIWYTTRRGTENDVPNVYRTVTRLGAVILGTLNKRCWYVLEARVRLISEWVDGWTCESWELRWLVACEAEHRHTWCCIINSKLCLERFHLAGF